MIKLHLFPPCEGAQISAPCAKVETYLRLTGQPFEPVESWDLAKAPKKKFPYIEDGDRVIPDSWFILRYLKETYGDILDGRLNDDQRLLAHGLSRILEESLYYCITYWRWIDTQGYQITRQSLFGQLPDAEQQATAGNIRELANNMLYYQGYSRHRPNELLEISAADLAAIATALGNKPYLLGDDPASIDCSGFATLEVILRSPVSPVFRDQVKNDFPVLLAYTEHMRERIADTP